MKSKTSKRTELLREISSVICNPEIYDTLNYRDKNEMYLKQYLYAPLKSRLAELAERKKGQKLIWEGDQKSTLHNITVFGTQHRPDFEINICDLQIGVEIKKGSAGSDIRNGIGQSIVYASHYDFVLYVFIDTSKDKKLLNSEKGDKEVAVINKLWDSFNIWFNIV